MRTRQRKHQCSICHEEGADVFGDGCTPGCHYFCEGCLSTWSETENTCPVCKAEFCNIVTKHGFKRVHSISRKRQRVPEDEEDGLSISLSERQWLALVFQQMFESSNGGLTMAMESIGPERMVVQASSGSVSLSFRLRRVRRRSMVAGADDAEEAAISGGGQAAAAQ